MKLKCTMCGKDHKARIDKFPIIVHGYAEVRKYPNSNYGPGSTIKREMIVKEIEVGHICRECQRKAAVKEFIKIHKLKQKPGQRMQEVINRKFKEVGRR